MDGGGGLFYLSSVVEVDFAKTEVGQALRRGGYSFDPPSGPFPLVVRRVAGEQYATNFVEDLRVFSASGGEPISLPVIHHAAPFEVFAGRDTFIHEAIHVLQRVLGTSRVPVYAYAMPGSRGVRNPVQYVRVGVEDEIEVQLVLTRAGYPFRIEPILHHRSNFSNAFAGSSPGELRDVIEQGLRAIPFERYAELHNGGLRAAVEHAFLDVHEARA